MAKTLCSIFILFYCFFSSFFVYAQDAQLTALQKKYSALSSFTVNFTQELYNSETKETEKRTGVFTFKKPLLILWKTSTPLEESIIVSTNEIWDYIPEDNIAFKYPITLINDVAIFAYILSGQSNIEDTFTIDKVENNGAKTTFFLTPKKEHPSVTSMLLTISKQTSEITEVKITDFYSNTNTIVLTNFVANPPVDNSIFSFTPKEGITVIDNSVDNSNE